MQMNGFAAQAVQLGQQPHPSLLRIDIAYYNSIMRILRTYSRYILYHSLKFITLVVFIPISNTEVKNRTLMVPFILAAILAILYILIYIYIRTQIKKVPTNLIIAASFGHTTVLGNAQSTMVEHDILEDIKSNEYDFSNAAPVDMPEEYKRKYQEVLSVSILAMHLNDLRIVKSAVNLLNVLSLTLILYLIISLATPTNLDAPTKAIAAIYIVFQCLAKIEIVLGLIFCAILPIGLLVICCCMCCCSRRLAYRQVPKIPVVRYNPSMALECDPECRICFQNFVNDEDIIVLPCDKKHVFHKFCIESWFKMSTTCPMCRKDLAAPVQNVPE